MFAFVAVSWVLIAGGVADRIGESARLISASTPQSNADKATLDAMVRDVVVGQFGATELPIVTNMDFGHTDPQWIMPLGVLAELDSDARTFRLLEPAVQ